ncbi:MAG: hypothetical protein B6D55_02440 [Candidatus Omnitrophica bacterium 4484_70.2]|nr:MAG: hypothetical protein B6D55_02440 [Candidatus Omnitrophica bacterium 4484_70.2]
MKLEIDREELKKAFSIAAGVVFGTFCAFKFLVDKGIIKEIADKLNRQLGNNENKELEDKTK